MAIIQSGATSDTLTIDPTSKAGRVTIYDSSGNAISGATDRGTVVDTAGGVMLAGKDYKVARTLRASTTGTLRTSDDSLFMYDAFEGTTRNQNVWLETATTMVSAQTTAVGLTLNNASTTTATTGILESSHRPIPFIARVGLVFRAHLRALGATNCVEEWGFSNQTSATTANHQNGAFFRRDAAGSLQPVLAFNGTETQGTVMTGPANTEYGWYEIFLEDSRALFQVFSHTGALLSSQVMEIGSSGGGAGSTTQARMFTVTHINVMLRVLNTGTAGTAPQIIVNHVSAFAVDSVSQRDWLTTLSGTGYSGITSPTTYAQTANYTNNTAPTARTLSNTAAAETTLGGLVRANSIAGGTTDLILFGFQVPSPYTFYFTGIRIPAPLNEVVAVATTATTFTYFMAFNSSAVSLATGAPYAPRFVALGGVHTGAIALAANAQFSGADVIWQPKMPIAVMPGKFLHIGCRELVGTATATETYQWAIAVEGYFE